VNKKKLVYTLGHSSRSIEEFMSIITTYNIKYVIDVRRFPSSRKFPHFNRQYLQEELAKKNIRYVWLGLFLGGKRGYVPGAEKFTCFKAQGYRNYVALMNTDEWKRAFNILKIIVRKGTTVILCAERLPWRCHRKLISDALIAEDFEVIHIIDTDRIIPHKLTSCARIIDGKLTYL